MTEAQALAFIEQYLQQHLPLTVAMQVQAVAYDGQTLRLNALRIRSGNRVWLAERSRSQI